MRGDQKWQSRLAQAVEDGDWGVLDVYSDEGADGAGAPAASAEYGLLVGCTDGDSLEVWAEGAARVGGLPEEMDSTRAELLGAYMYAILHEVRQWGGTVRIWVDNDNVVRGLGRGWGSKELMQCGQWQRTDQLTHRRWSPAGGCNWMWVLMVTCGKQWTCCWDE
jgi:hypothetical protein